MFYKMVMIVISRVLKYRAFIIALALVSALAFLQSNQSQSQQRLPRNLTDNETSESEQAEPPSIPETPDIPDLPDTPDLPDEEDNVNSGSSTASVSISVKTSIGDSGNGEDLEEETTIEEITNGSISLKFTSNDGRGKIRKKIEEEDGRASVSFRLKYDQDSKSEINIENSIEKEE